MTAVDHPNHEETPNKEPQRRTHPASQVVGGSVVVLIGVLWLLERAGVIEISLTAVLAVATTAVGLALMLLSSRDSQPGLIVFGVTLGVVTLLTALAPFEGFQGGVGDRQVDVASSEDIDAEYNLAMGTLTVDLSQVEGFDPGAELAASTGLGELLVLVPSEMSIEVRARVGAGVISVGQKETSGLGLRDTIRIPADSTGPVDLVLDVQVFMGRLEVSGG